MDLCNESYLSSWLGVLRGKNFNFVHYMQTVKPIFFISAVLIGTIDFFYHLIPRSLTLTLPGGHKVSAKQNLLASFSLQAFRLIGMKCDEVMEQFSLNILRPLLSKIY